MRPYEKFIASKNQAQIDNQEPSAQNLTRSAINTTTTQMVTRSLEPQIRDSFREDQYKWKGCKKK